MKRNKNLRPTWDKDQIHLFLSYLKDNDPDWYFICTVAILTGMRVGEQIALRWSNISFSEKLIRITESYDYSEKSYGPTKARRARVIPMNRQLIDLLQEKFVNTEKQSSSTFVLPRPAGFACGKPARWLRNVCEKLHLPTVHYHDLRGMFAQRAAFAGIPIHVIRDIGGWERLETVETYLRVAGKDLVGVTDNMRI